MVPGAADYRYAALERVGDAVELRRLERYSFAMYAAGVAAECMLRAFRHPDREHAAHHDVVAHFRSCDAEALGDRATRLLRGHVQTIHMLWLNNLRYTHEFRLRQHLNGLKYYTRLKKGSDTLKVACIELVEAAVQIVTKGNERWKNL